jgi:hypothetical protein
VQCLCRFSPTLASAETVFSKNEEKKKEKIKREKEKKAKKREKRKNFFSKKN